MGYSELHCFLCGVSFNIGRMRTREEPRTHAWSGTADWNITGLPVGCTWVDGLCNWGGPHCSTDEQGCSVVHRGDPNDQPRIRRRSFPPLEWEPEPIDLISDAESDADYVPTIDDAFEDHIVEEWTSDLEDTDDDKSNITSGSPNAKDLDMPSSPQAQAYNIFIDTFKGDSWVHSSPSAKVGEDFLAAPRNDEHYRSFPNAQNANINPGSSFEGKKLGEYEHIPGPDCHRDGGYSGHVIMAEEMLGCKTLQSLLQKPRGWEPESDDLDFELESRFFLTGLSDHAPSRDMDSPEFVPERHGAGEADRPGQVDVDEELYQGPLVGMPFHPSCFEIFIRQSRQRFGNIDVNGLMDWRNSDSGGFGIIPRDRDVEQSDNQWWEHHAETAYLGANPVLVPGLPQILWKAAERGLGAHGQDGVFDVRDGEKRHGSADAGDQLLRLSLELRLAILEQLDGASIAALRLASYAFRQLPHSIFYTLIRNEFPCLWEASQNAESDPSPYYWALLTQRDLSTYHKDKDNPVIRKLNEDLELYRTVIREEMPELYDMWIAAEPNLRQCYDAPNWPPEPYEQIRLKRGETNWFVMYCELHKGLRAGKLKGLRNRARIWKDVEFIVNRIAEAREQGHIA